MVIKIFCKQISLLILTYDSLAKNLLIRIKNKLLKCNILLFSLV